MESQHVLQCQRSQYSYANGRSACTFISLAAACRIGVSEWSSLRERDLESVLELGIEWYEACAPYLEGEHSSAQEAVSLLAAWGEGNLAQPSTMNYLIDVGLAEQRMLSASNIMEVVQGARHSRTSSVACLFTKAPETLMVLCGTDQEMRGRFLLFDSHPRPTQGIEGCSLVFYGSDLELATAILERLPVTRITDISESDLQMLNSFELTTLTVRERPQQNIERVPAQESAEQPAHTCCCKDLAVKMEVMGDRLERIEEAIARLLRVAGHEENNTRVLPIRESHIHTQSVPVWDIASGTLPARRTNRYDGVRAEVQDHRTRYNSESADGRFPEHSSNYLSRLNRAGTR